MIYIDSENGKEIFFLCVDIVLRFIGGEDNIYVQKICVIDLQMGGNCYIIELCDLMSYSLQCNIVINL